MCNSTYIMRNTWLARHKQPNITKGETIKRISKEEKENRRVNGFVFTSRCSSIEEDMGIVSTQTQRLVPIIKLVNLLTCRSRARKRTHEKNETNAEGVQWIAVPLSIEAKNTHSQIVLARFLPPPFFFKKKINQKRIRKKRSFPGDHGLRYQSPKGDGQQR